MVARIACPGLVFSSISAPFFSAELLRFAYEQCELPQPGEPTYSIAFFSIKVAAALLFVPLSWLIVATDRFRLPPASPLRRNFLSSTRGDDIVAFVIVMPAFAGIMYVMFLNYSLKVSPHEFNTSAIHKGIEDILCVVMPLLLAPWTVGLFDLGQTLRRWIVLKAASSRTGDTPEKSGPE
jgi:hypothetical protein